MAKLLKKGKFNALFIADVLGGYDVYNDPGNIKAVATSGAQWPVNEPSVVVPAMAAVTKNLAFGVTFSTISEAPYHFARKLATLDHLTKGRVGRNVVSSYLDSTARNLLQGEKLPPHDLRYERAEAYIQVIYELLLSSWSNDAVQLDREKGIYSDPNKIRTIDFEGKHFKVPGPAITEPTPQRMPVVLQADLPNAGKDFTPQYLGSKIKEIKEIAKERYGRNEDDIKFVQLVTPIIGEDQADGAESIKN